MAASRYGRVLRTPGVAQPVIGTAVGTLPIGMLGLAVLLLVQASRGGFAEAGLVVGVLGLGNGVGIVAQGRLLDRFGQWQVLLPAAALQVIALALLVVAADAAAPTGLLAALAFLAGLGEPQLTGGLRVLWPGLVGDTDLRPAAYALNSIVFEVPVVLGPLLVAALLAFEGPAVAVLAGGLLSAVGALLLATSAASRRWRAEPRAPVGWAGALSARGVRTLVLVGAGQGVVVTLLQLAAAGFAAEREQPAAAGLLFAAISAGSLAGALVWGMRLVEEVGTDGSFLAGAAVAALIAAVLVGRLATLRAPAGRFGR